MGPSCVEEPPIWTFGATTLEEEATGLVLGAIESSEEDREKEEKARAFLRRTKFLTLTQSSTKKK